MTAVVDSREALERTLDASPWDTLTRRVLADLLDDAGGHARARMLRWTAGERKWPHHHPAPPKGRQVPFPWVWTCEAGLPECLPHAGLPRLLCKLMGFREWQAYPSRRAAEDALFAAWQEVGW
jgi:uncharacterized protein (TIGR02996 family)